MEAALLRRIVHDALDDPDDVVALLRAGAHHANTHTDEQDHGMVLVDGLDHIRMLSYPEHPETDRRLDVSLIPRMLAEGVAAAGHGDSPIRYRFLDNLRSAEVLEDPEGIAASMAKRADELVRTDRLLGDYVHSVSAYVEDLWGQWDRGDLRSTWMVAREVAVGAVGMLWEEEQGGIPGPIRFPERVGELPTRFQDAWDRLHRVPDDAVPLLTDVVDLVEARGNVPFREEPDLGQRERELLEDVATIAEDLEQEHGDRVQAVGATGSIGRNSATEDADYDVHVLVEPRSEEERHRIDFRLHMPTYPGLDRRAELGFTPTSFLDQLMDRGLRFPFAYHHLDHVRHTALVHDPDGVGEAYKARVWDQRPSEEYVEARLEGARRTIEAMEGEADRVRWSIAHDVADEAARLLLMRYGLGFVKPKYKSLNLDRIRDEEPTFFEAYDQLKGFDGLDRSRALGAARDVTRLYDHVLDEVGAGFRYRCAEMDLGTPSA